MSHEKKVITKKGVAISINREITTKSKNVIDQNIKINVQVDVNKMLSRDIRQYSLSYIVAKLFRILERILIGELGNAGKDIVEKLDTSVRKQCEDHIFESINREIIIKRLCM